MRVVEDRLGCPVALDDELVDIVGIYPNEEALIRLAGMLLVEPTDSG